MMVYRPIKSIRGNNDRTNKLYMVPLATGNWYAWFAMPAMFRHVAHGL
jgi:hypothetical protein